jgi:hypothetical protein
MTGTFWYFCNVLFKNEVAEAGLYFRFPKKKTVFEVLPRCSLSLSPFLPPLSLSVFFSLSVML